MLFISNECCLSSNQAFQSESRKRQLLPKCGISRRRANLARSRHEPEGTERSVHWGSNSRTMERPLTSGLETAGNERGISVSFHPDNAPVFRSCPRLNSKDLIAPGHHRSNLGEKESLPEPFDQHGSSTKVSNDLDLKAHYFFLNCSASEAARP